MREAEPQPIGPLAPGALVAGPGSEPIHDAAELGAAEPDAAEPDAADVLASDDDTRLIRRVRIRLVAWSGLSTLVVLLLLAVALYAAVANTLEAASVQQLNDRATPLAEALEGPNAETQTRPPLGFQIGAGNTFLFAFDANGAPVQIGRGPVVVPEGLPQQAGLAAARTAANGTDIRNSTLEIQETSSIVSVPVRVLTRRVVAVQDGNTYFLQAFQDRSTEVGTLDALLVVLLVGGLVVLVVAFGFGAVYGRRALVPIRDSLATQRAALRRQREFAADASHELRTPLTVIRSSVEHLRRHASEPVAKVDDALDDIDAEVQHLTSLVDDLLLLARSDSGAITLERIPVQLDDVAAEAAAALAAPAEARGVRLLVDPSPAPMSGDPARLRQLVMILVDNAIKHSPAGGEVRITVRSADGRATLSVADQGPGIRAADLPHVFDRFWRAPGAPSGGTGLGLSIAKWIAERHDGSVVAESPAGGGAVFEVRLPAHSTTMA
jgi:signal transduction histidine kinase